MIDPVPPISWDQVTTEIMSLYETRGDQHYGEGVSQIEHAAQAARQAADENAGPSMIAAAFLHDIGHLLDRGADASSVGDRDRVHERIGAKWIARRLGPEIAGPIGAHVDAKRYLCAVEPDYRSTLSDASRESLTLQGGAMQASEVEAFGRRPDLNKVIALRRWDDAGKVPGQLPMTVREFVALIQQLGPNL